MKLIAILRKRRAARGIHRRVRFPVNNGGKGLFLSREAHVRLTRLGHDVSNWHDAVVRVGQQVP